MEKLDFDVEFLTPTFLGGADQDAELRSPPFKNLIRQWWRILNGGSTVEKLRETENSLFGSVLEKKAAASKVRITITPGDNFKLSEDNLDFGSTKHPEVNASSIRNDLYLGYGPITFKKGITTTKTYIAPDSHAKLSISLPKKHREQIIRIIQMIDAFGTIGSRNRNGYGSLAVSSADMKRLAPETVISSPWTTLLADKQYPHGFGKDGKGLLLWESGKHDKWQNAMQQLATTYLNTRVGINIKGNANQLHERHLLGFPVTNHKNITDPKTNWGSNDRMPSQLRLMVKRNTNNQLVARIFHLPHKLPKTWPTELATEQTIWRQVHGYLDEQKEFHRTGGGA